MDLDVFVRLERPVSALADYLSDLFGFRLPLVDVDRGKRAVFSCLNVELALFDNPGMENDGGILFERYDVEIALTKITPPEPSDPFVRELAFHLAKLISFEFRCEARVVEDLQISLAAYARGERVE